MDAHLVVRYVGFRLCKKRSFLSFVLRDHKVRHPLFQEFQGKFEGERAGCQPSQSFAVLLGSVAMILELL